MTRIKNNQQVLDTVEITQVLNQLRDRPELLHERLFSLLYPSLRKIARKQLSAEGSARTLQPTALVNEAYMRLRTAEPDWQNRAHFLACAANAMRQVLVDYARRRISRKRGSGQEALPLDEFIAAQPVSLEDVLTVHLALEKLRRIDPLKAQLLELRFFGGLTIEESAQVLGIGLTATKDHFRMARAWCNREFTRNPSREGRA